MSTQVVFTGTAEKRSPGDRRSSCKTVRQPGACRPLCPGAAGADGDPGAVPGIRRIPAGPDAEEQRLPFLTHKDYLLFYRYERAEGRVYIMAIFHGRLDYLRVMQQFL